MVNRYYRKHKEKFQKEACERYQNLSEEEKLNRWKKARDRHQNLFEEKEKSVSSIVNVIRIFLKNKKKRKLSIWEIIIYHIRNKFWVAFFSFLNVAGNQGYLGQNQKSF